MEELFFTSAINIYTFQAYFIIRGEGKMTQKGVTS